MVSTDITAWYDAIALKTKSEVAEVKIILDRHSVRPLIRPAVPQRIRVLSLKFTGKKAGLLDDDIDFSWDGLGVGLHAIVSRINLKGKTTLLKLMQLGLNGHTAVPGDMHHWFRTMTLRFAVDDDLFETRIEDFAAQRGVLISLKGDRERTVATFHDAASFESAMETFFFDKLGLNVTKIVVNSKGKEVVQEHGWSWLSSVLTIEPNPDNAFGGNHFVGGMETYLMRMFIGLPWIGTHTAIKAAIKSISIEDASAGQASVRNRDSARKRLSELETARAAVGQKLAGPDRLEVVVSKERTAIHRLAGLSAEVQTLTRRKATMADDVVSAEAAVTHIVRERHGFDEATQAGAVFRLLRPEYCPSCDEIFTDELREERGRHHDCIVCGRKETEEEDLTGVREAIVQREEEAKSQLAKLRVSLKKLENSVTEKEGERDRLETELDQLQKEIGAADTPTETWKEALKLDAQIEEVRRLVGETAASPNADLGVLKAAESVTEGLFKAEQTDILADVATEATELARSFGIVMLESIEFQGVMMKVRKGGSVQSFSGCTPGEKKRLKIATVLAMLRVSEARGVGRHPGILLVDSPRTDETVDEDVVEIVKGFAALSKNLADVQVFLTAVSTPAILEHVPRDKVRKSREDDWMW